MELAVLWLSALCALSWYGLYNKYQDNEHLHERLEMAEANNSVLARELEAEAFIGAQNIQPEDIAIWTGDIAALKATYENYKEAKAAFAG